MPGLLTPTNHHKPMEQKGNSLAIGAEIQPQEI